MAEMPPSIRAPANLPSLVKDAFTKARTSGDLTYYPTQVAILKLNNSIPFQLRFSPALAAKPKAAKPKDSSSANAKPFNPFENPLPVMTVAQLPPAHVLVLNKFAIVPEHFILVTKAFKPQTHVLEREDIEATYACIQAYHDAGGEELFAFFNSGEHSGASQPHRHVQLLPVKRMREGLDEIQDGGDGSGGEWDVLVNKIQGQESKLPFTILAETIAPGSKAKDLHRAYVSLYKRAARLVLSGDGDIPGEGEARISYNFAMTWTSMALCPRIAEGALIRAGEDSGAVALNGTVLAGTALVKNQAEWDALREDPDLLLGVLKQIGVTAKKNGSL